MQMSKCLFITFKLRGQSNTYFSFEPILAPVCDLVKRLSILYICRFVARNGSQGTVSVQIDKLETHLASIVIN